MNKYDLDKIIEQYKIICGIKNSHKNIIQEESQSNIVLEMVHNQTLKPLSREFWIEMCKRINKKKNNVFIITFEQMYNKMEKVNWQDSEIFKQNLEQLNSFNDGQIYVVVCTSNYKDLFEITKKLPQKDLNKLNKFISECTTGVVGNTSTKNTILLDKDHDVFLYLNINNPAIKHTFEHEITHLIERIIHAKNGASNINSNKSCNLNKLYNTLYVCELFDDQIKLLMGMANTIFNPREYTTVQKSIINGFKDMYEQQYIKWKNENKYKNNYSKVEIGHNKEQYLEQRQEWLDQYLISDEEFFTNHKKEIQEFCDGYIKFLKLGIDLTKKDFKFRYKNLLTIIEYHLFNLLYQNIDDKIRDEFNTFIFREG